MPHSNTIANLPAVALLLATFSATQILAANQGQCVFGMKTCGYVEDAEGHKLPIPCKYDGPPRVIDDRKLLTQLDELCPALNVLDNSQQGLCCDAEQIGQFVSNIQRAKDIIGNCPSCFINFSHLFCDLTCNPNQASFVKVTKSSKVVPPSSKPTIPAQLPSSSASSSNNTQDNQSSSGNSNDKPEENFELVDEISYNVSTKFVDGLFYSCKDVYWAGAQTKAIDILCGEKCTPREWVEHLGIKGNSPFEVKYQYLKEERLPAVPCNSSVGEYYPRLKNMYQSRCSYADCPSDVGPQPVPETPWIVKVGGVYVLVTFLCVIMAVLISIVFDYYGDYDHCAIDSLLSRLFTRWALFCSRYATLVILIGFAGVALSCVGLTKLEVLTDPVNLWSQANSLAYQEKIYFEKTFGPFYRVQQVIIYPSGGVEDWKQYNGDPNKTFTNVFKLDFLMSALKLQKAILDLNATHEEKPVKLQDICIQPLGNKICAVQSPLDWFQGDEKNFNLGPNLARRAIEGNSTGIEILGSTFKSSEVNNTAYLTHFMSCFNNAFEPRDKNYHSLSCLGPYGGPILKQVGLGGYPGDSYWAANSLIISIPLNNSIEINREAKAWESKFIELLHTYKDPNLKLSFYSERSIEDEIERQSQSDVFTVAISYLVMFVYIALSLGRSTNLRTFLIESRIVLGLGGILIVLASVLASIGILSFFGAKATLIIIEVIPFLVLAVGVDNIFILVQALQRSAHLPSQVGKTAEERISTVVGEVAPSLLLASLSESACFLIGTLTPMPAVRIFAMTASLALVIDFVLQMTVFIALLTLDTKRQIAGRYDLICCLKVTNNREKSLMGSPDLGSDHSLPRPDAASNGSGDSSVTPMTSPNIDSHSDQRHLAPTSSDARAERRFKLPSSDQDPLYHLFENFIAPALMKPIIRSIAVSIFLAWLCTSLLVVHRIDVGLDQTMSVPEDSYMQDYFKSQKNDLRVGPPVFFVLKKGLDFKNSSERNVVCASDGCLPFSMVSKISQASQEPHRSYIATPSNSWIDDYRKWGDNPSCCRMFNDQSQTTSNNISANSIETTKAPTYQSLMKFSNKKFCPYTTPNITKRCSKCDLISDNKFDPDQFNDYVENFLNDPTRTDCVVGGSAVYSNWVRVLRGKSDPSNDVQIDSAFSTYHVPLKDSKDFIESMKSARRIAQDIEEMLNVNLRSQSSQNAEKLQVFPYCFTYVFYEQYLNIWPQTFRNLSISMATIFIVTYLLLGCDLYISSVVIGTIASIIINLMGLMYFWDIQLNAISLVNLVMAVGISVEFCSHIARAFALSKRNRPVDRAQDALIKMGSSVLSGITFTKIAGISVLACAKSNIFKVYYFRMYLGMVLVGAVHGIIFMPIILSLTARERKPSSSTDA